MLLLGISVLWNYLCALLCWHEVPLAVWFKLLFWWFFCITVIKVD